MAETEDGMDGVNEASGGKKKVCKRCRKKFTVPGQGNFLYCSEVCRMLYIKPRSSSISGSQSEKRKRSNSINSPNSVDDMTREELIILIKDLTEDKENLYQENECLTNHTKEIGSELISIKVKIADKFLNKFVNSDQPIKEKVGDKAGNSNGNQLSFSSAAKRAVLVAKLDTNQDTSDITGQSLDKFFSSNCEWPTLQHCTKKADNLYMRFGSEKDMEKAKEIIAQAAGTKVTAIEEKKGHYPVVIYHTGIEDLEKIKKELEYRNDILKGNITGIRILSKTKGYIKIYVSSKECQEALLREGEVFSMSLKNNFTRHHVVAMNLNFEVTRCFKCQKYGHVASQCPNKDPNYNCCGRCSESHKTSTCLKADSAVK